MKIFKNKNIISFVFRVFKKEYEVRLIFLFKILI